MKLFIALAAAFAMSAAHHNTAQTASPELGLPIGAKIPHDLTAISHDGTIQTFQTLAGEKGLALFFVRSVDWCPYCQAQVMEVSARANEFVERGLNVVFLSYDPPETQQSFIERKNITPPFLSDADIGIINAFGLRNNNYEEGSRAYGAPHPAVFVIDNNCIIAAKLYEDDYAENEKSYRKRPPVDVILSAVDEAIEAGRL